MGTNIRDKIKKLPPERQARIRAGTDKLIEEELTLQDLRKAANKTQIAISQELNIGQGAVSRLEKRSDLLVSTLGNYVRALGGQLEITAHFPGRSPVRVHGIGDLLRNSTKRSAKSTHKKRA